MNKPETVISIRPGGTFVALWSEDIYSRTHPHPKTT